MRGPIECRWKTRLPVLTHYGGSSVDFICPALPALGYFSLRKRFSALLHSVGLAVDVILRKAFGFDSAERLTGGGPTNEV